MRYLIISDLHGSSSGARRIQSIVEEEKPDAILMLGDMLHHGRDEDPYYAANVLRSLPCGLVGVKGNCDYSSDEELLSIELPNIRQIPFRLTHTIYMIHHPSGIPLPPGDIFMHGHTHCKRLEKIGGAIYFNPGSIAYARDDGPGYGILTEEKIELKDALTREVIQSISLI